MASADQGASDQSRQAAIWSWAQRSRRRTVVVPSTYSPTALARPPGVVAQAWHAPGGQTALGRVLPACIGVCALLAVAGAIYAPVRSASMGIFPAVLLSLLAALAGWLVWKIVGTVWLVATTTDNELLCWAARRYWSLSAGEVLAVKGDAYGLFLVLVTTQGKIWLWAQMADRPGLLAAIRRSSRGAEVDHYAEPPLR